MVKKIATLFIACALLVACSKNALTGKNQLTLLPEAELQTMAIGEYQQFLSSNKVVASTNNKDAEMVKRVGNRIVKAVEEFYGVQVINVNTSVTPGKAKSRNTKAGVVSGRKPAKKKAYVTVAEGETIDLYGTV